MGFGGLSRGSWDVRMPGGLGRSILWILASLVPVLFLVRLLALTLYSIPEADDYCLSYLNGADGFIEATAIWYRGVVGRIVPLVLIQVPAAISRVTDVDYLITYVAVLVLIEIGFVAATIAFVRRLWPQATTPQTVFVGTALSAVILSNVPSLREFLYWLPGATCYAVPGAIMLLLLAELIRSVEFRARITPVAVCALAVGCFIAALCNEFTPVWLLGLIVGSLLFRAIVWRDGLQAREHAIIAAATLVGFAILLLAPGNSVRMGAFPNSGQLSRSIGEAFRVVTADLRVFAGEPRTAIWFIAVLIFTMIQPPPVRKAGRERIALAVLVMMFCGGCVYLPYVAAQYGMGSSLPPRTQNETVILLVACLTAETALLGRALAGWVTTASINPRIKLAGEAIAAVALGAMLISSLWNGGTMKLLRLEHDFFRTFWLESAARHAQLMMAKEDDLVLAGHSVFPTALMAYELGDQPNRLPNDCVAQFYGKKSVIVKMPVQEATASEVAAVLPKLIGGLRAHHASLKRGLLTPVDVMLSDVEVPSLLVFRQNFSSPWGSVVLAKSKENVTLDFHGVSGNVCRELPVAGSRIDGVAKVAGSSSPTAEKWPAPIGPELAQRACPNDGAVARLIIQ